MPIATQTIVTSKDGRIPNHISAINSEPLASAREDRNSELLSKSTASFSCNSIEFSRNKLSLKRKIPATAVAPKHHSMDFS